LSFAQFEREVADERIRDKIAASKNKGMCTNRLFGSAGAAAK
jgi:DNA invertase Pin-like site-specific DNA recombinase